MYCDIRGLIKKNFALMHLTSHHAAPDMTKTFNEVLKNLQEMGPHKIQPGRSMAHNIPMALNKGRVLLESGGGDNGEEESNDKENECRLEADDIISEIYPLDVAEVGV